MNIALLIAALKVGNKLTNSTTWKNRATALNVVTPLVLAGGAWAYSKGYLPEGITEEDLLGIASFVVTIVMWVSGYMHQATSGKVGIGSTPDEYKTPAEVELGVLQRDNGVWKAIQNGEVVDEPVMTDMHPSTDPGLDSFNR